MSYGKHYYCNNALSCNVIRLCNCGKEVVTTVQGKEAIAGVILNAANNYQAVSVSFSPSFPVQDLSELTLKTSSEEVYDLKDRLYVSDPLDVPNNLHNLVFLGLEPSGDFSYTVKVFDAVTVNLSEMVKGIENDDSETVFGIMCSYEIVKKNDQWVVSSVQMGHRYVKDTPISRGAFTNPMKKSTLEVVSFDSTLLGTKWILFTKDKNSGIVWGEGSATNLSGGFVYQAVEGNSVGNIGR